jgi:hypothetical protein
MGIQEGETTMVVRRGLEPPKLLESILVLASCLPDS